LGNFGIEMAMKCQGIKKYKKPPKDIQKPIWDGFQLPGASVKEFFGFPPTSAWANQQGNAD